MANQDVGLGYNTALWRTVQEGTPYSDGKWRFMLYDLDECACRDGNAEDGNEKNDDGGAGNAPSGDEKNGGTRTGNAPNGNDEVGRENWAEENALLCEPMIKSLLDNEGFRRRFCISFMDIANTTFSYGRIHPMLAEWGDAYGIQVVKDRRRFFDDTYDLEDFHEEMEQMDDFFKKRFGVAMENLADTFGLSGNLVRVNISSNIPERGTIRHFLKYMFQKEESMSAKDIIKNSIYKALGGGTGLTSKTVVFILLMACLIGVYIFFVYKMSGKPGFYSKDLNITLCGMPVIIAAIMIAMQSNLLVSLGMVGALSIVRFRNAVKNPMDLLYLFWSISAGIAAGFGKYGFFYPDKLHLP